MVDVTEDHGLLDLDANKISPKDIKVGSTLLTSDLPVDCEYTFTGINKDLAFVMGLFYANGSCGSKVSTWDINNADRKLLEKCENILNILCYYEFEELSFNIIESSNVLKLVASGKDIEPFIETWRDLFYDKVKYKKVPDEILWSNKEVRQSFFDGYTGDDGDKNDYSFDNKGKIGSSGLYFLASSLGYNVSINIRKYKPDIYTLTCTKSPLQKNENVVKKIESLGNTEQYVYDLETESHHFSAGIGKLIVHNTDCVLATEPVLIKKDNTIDYKTVEELSDGNWTRINPNKEISNPKSGYQIWSDKGFTNIVNVVRCGIKKPLSRVLTNAGVVVCSNEHSLLTEDLKSITPLNTKVGDKLCTSDLPLPRDTPKIPIRITTETINNYIMTDCVYQGLTTQLAFVWGLFYIDGFCNENSWEINNKDNKLLEDVYKILKDNEQNVSFEILVCHSSNRNKLVPKELSNKKDTNANLIHKYRNLFYDNRNNKKIPTIIYNSPFDIRQSFFMGYYSGDENRNNPQISLSNKGAIGSAGLFYLMRSIGYKLNINTCEENPDVFELIDSSAEENMIQNEVKQITVYKGPENEYIYDIQTDNHHFAAGVGQLVVHNSNYIHFPHLKTAEESWDYAIKVATEVSKLFPPPMKLDFEEVIYRRFFILTKKRYMYKSCGREGIVSDKVGKKGVLLARRDTSVFIRNLYEQIIMKIFDKEDRDDILYFIIQQFNKLCSNSFPYKDFVVTKSVGDTHNMQPIQHFDEKGKEKVKIGDYIVPKLPTDKKEREEQFKKKNVSTEKEYYEKCLPSQVQLAEKMKNRGKPVQVGSRLEFLISDIDNHQGKQYDKLESIDYFLDHSDVLKVDFFYYIKIGINSIDEILNIAFQKDNEMRYKYKFKMDFVQEQYNFRYKIRRKVLDEIKSLFKPKLVF